MMATRNLRSDLSGAHIVEPAAAVLVIVVLGTIVTTWRTLRIANFPGRGDYLLLMAAATWWAVCAMLEVSSKQAEVRIFYSELAWFGILTTPMFWMLFVVAYVRGADLPNAPVHTGLSIAAGLLGLALAITNDLHHLVYVTITPDPTPSFPERLSYAHGPAFYAMMLAIYFFMMVVMARVIWAAILAPPVMRVQFAGLLISALLPWAANAAYNIGGLRVLGFDPTPLAFSITPFIYNFLISRNRFLTLAPVALKAVIASHPDGILVVANSGLIVEANEASKTIFGMDNLIGRDFADFRVSLMPGERNSLFGSSGTALHCEKNGRIYEVRKVAIDAGRRSECVAYVLRDITDYLRAQESLRVSTRLMEERLEANLRLQEQLHDMAHRDSLTGLNNRRVLQDIGGRLVANADAVARSLVAVSLDLDHFKRLNDTFGHKVGDDALVAVATILSRSLRPGEVAVRMGGEEFLVLMPDADIEEARARAEAWRAVIRSQPVETPQGPAEITFSAGISAYPDTASSFEQLLQQADTAVYAAKRAGRNRVVIARQRVEFGDGRSLTA